MSRTNKPSDQRPSAVPSEEGAVDGLLLAGEGAWMFVLRNWWLWPVLGVAASIVIAFRPGGVARRKGRWFMPSA